VRNLQRTRLSLWRSKEKAVDSVVAVEEEEEVAITPTVDGHQDEVMEQMVDQVEQVASETVLHDQDGVLNGQLVKLVLSNAMQGNASFPSLFFRCSYLE